MEVKIDNKNELELVPVLPGQDRLPGEMPD